MLARKYKSQCEELQKGKDSVSGKEGESMETGQEGDGKQMEDLDKENKKLSDQVEQMQTVQKDNEQLSRDIEQLKASLKEAEATVSRLNSKSRESFEKDGDLENKIAELKENIDKLTEENTSNKVISYVECSFLLVSPGRHMSYVRDLNQMLTYFITYSKG